MQFLIYIGHVKKYKIINFSQKINVLVLIRVYWWENWSKINKRTGTFIRNSRVLLKILSYVTQNLTCQKIPFLRVRAQNSCQTILLRTNSMRIHPLQKFSTSHTQSQGEVNLLAKPQCLTWIHDQYIAWLYLIRIYVMGTTLVQFQSCSV